MTASKPPDEGTPRTDELRDYEERMALGNDYWPAFCRSGNHADDNGAFIVALVNAYPALKAAHAAAATAARNDALEEAARVLDTTFPDDWSEWAAAKIRALAAQGKG